MYYLLSNWSVVFKLEGTAIEIVLITGDCTPLEEDWWRERGQRSGPIELRSRHPYIVQGRSH